MILIITVAYNRPDFIPYQYHCFQKFLSEPFTYIVYNNADTEENSMAINRVCQENKIQCFNVPQSIHRNDAPSVRCAMSLNYAIEHSIVSHQGLALIIDSDMFLIRPLNISEYTNEFDICAIPQERSSKDIRLDYITNQLIFMNTITLPNLSMFKMDCINVMGVCTDTGGAYYHYKMENPSVKQKDITYIWSETPCNHYINTVKDDRIKEYMIKDSVSETQGAFAELYLDHSFLHYRAGSNWINKSPSETRSRNQALYTLLDLILA
jgi:glycosyltransferase involved in cell wall biosynthesis